MIIVSLKAKTSLSGAPFLRARARSFGDCFLGRVSWPLDRIGALTALFVTVRISHSAAIPAMTSAAPRATTGAALRQRAGTGAGSRCTGSREPGRSIPQTRQKPSSNEA
ncbi:MAG: hypothetical protein E6J42_00490 [Chloroflexi bacterium]|nr:MAG: hypothetical protein E6J42_00490 [Chloroflexota bacterium]